MEELFGHQHLHDHSLSNWRSLVLPHSTAQVCRLAICAVVVCVCACACACAKFLKFRRFRSKFDRPEIRLQLGFLYDGYSKDTWWFELVMMCRAAWVWSRPHQRGACVKVDMTHKLMLTSIVNFFTTDVQIPLAMCVAITYLIIILLRKPYYRLALGPFSFCSYRCWVSCGVMAVIASIGRATIVFIVSLKFRS